MLEDRDGAVLAQCALYFREQWHMLCYADMMEHTGRERYVEAVRRERQRRTVEMREVREIAEASARDVQALARHVDPHDLRIRKMLSQVDDGVAHPTTEIKNGQRQARPPSQGSLAQLSCKLRKTRLLAGDLYVRAVERFVLFGEPIEFGRVHGFS